MHVDKTAETQERKRRLKKKHNHDMIVNKKAGGVMVTETPKALKKEALKAISEMCLLDDNLMALVFDRNTEACC